MSYPGSFMGCDTPKNRCINVVLGMVSRFQMAKAPQSSGRFQGDRWRTIADKTTGGTHFERLNVRNFTSFSSFLANNTPKIGLDELFPEQSEHHVHRQSWWSLTQLQLYGTLFEEP